ncbi:MAG TPA: ATP-binding protein [Gemmatimonadaceae bacterium]|nr:ATP-binding protein [Gemmatimonadaceae bacterium]
MEAPTIEERPVLRWMYAARLILATAMYFAAVSVWLEAEGASTLISSAALIAALVFTGGSFFYTDVYGGRPGNTFRYLQSLFDLLLVTAIVHVTGGVESPFTALYILVIAAAALLHDARGVVLVASLGIVVYFADALLVHEFVFERPLALQLVLFAAVALGSGVIAARLRSHGAAREQMAAELAMFRLREADVQRLRARAGRLEAVAQLSSSLAHEIKNPLAAISSAVEQLGGSARSTDDERSLAELVTRESERLSRLLGEFLDFSRLDLADRRTLDMRDVVRGAVQLAESHPEKSENVAMAMMLPDRALLVDGDADVLHRALFNLVLNAIQASSAGGVVLVEAEALSPRQTPVGEEAFLRGSVAVRVSDHGPGVPQAILDRVFDPFFTTKERGSGLGLAIVHRSIAAHGGHVVVDSNSYGARFTVILPRTATPAKAQRAMHG